jgi:hypothetical protein
MSNWQALETEGAVRLCKDAQFIPIQTIFVIPRDISQYSQMICSAGCECTIHVCVIVNNFRSKVVSHLVQLQRALWFTEQQHAQRGHVKTVNLYTQMLVICSPLVIYYGRKERRHRRVRSQRG